MLQRRYAIRLCAKRGVVILSRLVGLSVLVEGIAQEAGILSQVHGIEVGLDAWPRCSIAIIMLNFNQYYCKLLFYEFLHQKVS